MSPTNLRARRVNERLATEDRIRLFIEEWVMADAGHLPDVNVIALITGARSESVVKAVLWDTGRR